MQRFYQGLDASKLQSRKKEIEEFVLPPCHVLPLQEMEADVQRFYQGLEAAGVPARYTHRQAGDLQWQYCDWLADACGERLLGFLGFYLS